MGLIARDGRPEQGGSDRDVGLGLYIVKEIAKAHAGQVSVRSTVAEGTSFNLTMARMG